MIATDTVVSAELHLRVTRRSGDSRTLVIPLGASIAEREPRPVDAERPRNALVDRWLADRCDLDAAAQTPTAELFASWRDWCRTHDAPEGRPRTFVQALRAHGLRSYRTAKLRGVRGVRLSRSPRCDAVAREGVSGVDR